MKKIKKSISMFLSLIMILSVFTIIPAVTAGALDGVSYIDENGEAQTANGVTAVTSGTTSLSAGWYAVTADTEINSRITCTGDVRLILCDGAKLTGSKGIGVSEGNSITIYGQSGGIGELEIDDSGATYEAALGSNEATDSGIITINGGKITATGGVRGAAIGSGYNAECTVIINGGDIQATGGFGGAAIGSGAQGSGTVTINGGNVTATGGDYGAAIGGGMSGSYAVVINGGNVVATSSGSGDGIGDGAYSTEGTISLSWTNKSDSIYTNFISSTVTLKKPFHDGTSINDVGTIYEAGVVSDFTALDNKTLRPYYPIFAGHSISLNGDIGLNFYLNSASEGADLHFEWYNKTYDHTVTAADYDATSGYYKVQVNVAAAEMSCPITATLTNANGDSAVETYCVRDYADVILNSESDFSKGFVAANGAKKYAVLVDLIKKTLDYGAKAQTRFGVTGFELANNGIDYTMQPITADDIITKKTDMTKGLSKLGLTYVGTSVVFLSQTTLRHYYVVTNHDLFDSFKASANFTYGEKGSRIYFDRKDISASLLDAAQTFGIGESEYNYSVLDYCKLVIADQNKSQADRELCMATYWYNKAAKAYFYGTDEYEDEMM